MRLAEKSTKPSSKIYHKTRLLDAYTNLLPCIAIGGGTDVAIESAGIILVRSNPLDVVKINTLSRASYRKMIQNLWWATGHNIVALSLDAGVLALSGILLSPAVGALFMPLSTIIVAVNAQLMRQTSFASLFFTSPKLPQAL